MAKMVRIAAITATPSNRRLDSPPRSAGHPAYKPRAASTSKSTGPPPLGLAETVIPNASLAWAQGNSDPMTTATAPPTRIHPVVDTLPRLADWVAGLAVRATGGAHPGGAGRVASRVAAG